MSQIRTASDVMRLYLERVVGAGEIDLLDEIAHEDMIDETAVSVGWGPGRRGLRRHVKYFRSAVPDPAVQIETLVEQADRVVGMWRVTGTHAGELFGVEATRRPLDYRNVSIFYVRESQIVHYTGVWGALDAVRQMGVPISLPR